MHIAILISGMLRDADKVYTYNTDLLKSCFPSSSFDTFVSVSSMRYNSEDKRTSENVTFETLHGIYKDTAHLDVADYQGMPGSFQTLRLHHMRWRMQRVWDVFLRSRSHKAYNYLLWMRPDVRIEHGFDHKRVSVGNNIHSLIGVDKDTDFMFWGPYAPMSILLTQFGGEFTEKCACLHGRPLVSNTFPVSDHVCRQAPGSNGGITYCVVMQRLEKIGSQLVLTNYTTTRLVSLSRCARGDTSHCA